MFRVGNCDLGDQTDREKQDFWKDGCSYPVKMFMLANIDFFQVNNLFNRITCYLGSF